MFCGNCGKQNPDGAKFCTACGSALDSAPVYQAPPVQQPAPAKKKSGGVKKFIISAVVFVVFFVCSYVAATWENSLPDVEPSSATPSSEFSQVFWENGINTPDSDFAGQGLDTVSYAIAYDNGVVENLEYVYEDGCVLAYIDTMFVPVFGQTEEYKAALDESVRTNLAQLTSLSFCQLSSYEDNGFYVYKLIYTDLDQKENVRQLSKTDVVILPEGETSMEKIGIRFTEDSLLASGYVKR